MRPYLSRLVITIDPDTSSIGQSAATGFRRQDVQSLVRPFDPAATLTEHGDVAMDNGETSISLVRWEAADRPAVGVPDQQTLERLVCAALVAAYPNRGATVAAWLESRADAPATTPKEFAWSHMAGWYANAGCEGFYRAVWGYPQLVTELRTRLTACGAWRVAEVLAE